MKSYFRVSKCKNPHIHSPSCPSCHDNGGGNTCILYHNKVYRCYLNRDVLQGPDTRDHTYICMCMCTDTHYTYTKKYIRTHTHIHICIYTDDSYGTNQDNHPGPHCSLGTFTNKLRDDVFIVFDQASTSMVALLCLYPLNTQSGHRRKSFESLTWTPIVHPKRPLQKPWP